MVTPTKPLISYKSPVKTTYGVLYNSNKKSGAVQLKQEVRGRADPTILTTQSLAEVATLDRTKIICIQDLRETNNKFTTKRRDLKRHSF